MLLYPSQLRLCYIKRGVDHFHPAVAEADAADMLYYVHDPMCSWCWGFAPVLGQLLKRLPVDVQVTRLLGGLAVDSDQPMPLALQQTIAATWRRIQERIPATQFNFDFWTQCAPRRSTWPACRAVIAARQQGEEFDARMTRAIQQAYYTQARNPSDEMTLIELAVQLGLDEQAFARALSGEPVQQQLLMEIERTRQLHATSFPGLVLEAAGNIWPIPVNYNDSAPMLEMIAGLR